MTKFLVGPLALGDVPAQGHNFQAVARTHRRSVDLNRNRFPVRMHIINFQSPHQTIADAFLDFLRIPRLVISGGPLGHAPAQNLFPLRIAGQPHVFVIGVKHPALGVHDYEAGGRGFDQHPVFILAFPQGRLGLLALGDIFVSSQDTDDPPLQIAQRNFAGAQPQLRAGRCGLWFFVAELGHAAGDDSLIVSAVQFRLVLPRHVKIVLARQRRRRIKARVPGKRLITAPIPPGHILPENPHRNCVEHRAQHPPGLFQRQLARRRAVMLWKTQ